MGTDTLVSFLWAAKKAAIRLRMKEVRKEGVVSEGKRSLLEVPLQTEMAASIVIT